MDQYLSKNQYVAEDEESPKPQNEEEKGKEQVSECDFAATHNIIVKCTLHEFGWDRGFFCLRGGGGEESFFTKQSSALGALSHGILYILPDMHSSYSAKVYCA